MGTELHANAASGVGEHGERHYDVFLVGGGLAGLGAAIACAQRGMRVGVCDLAYPPIDKALGEGLLPDAIDAASALGIDLLGAGQHFHGIRFLYRDQSVEARFSSGTGLGARRTMLHSRAVERAEALGIELLWEQSYDPASVKARWVIGADGGESAVRRWSGMHEGMWESIRYGFRRHYAVEPWSDVVEVYWGPRFQIYVTPVGPEEVGVAVLSHDMQFRVDDALLHFPALQERLSNAPESSSERGGISAMRSLPVVTQGSVALIGDASGAVDAITGVGVGLAFRQALALADALAASDPAQYEAAHRRIFRGPRWMARALLVMDRYPALGMNLLHRNRDMFSGLLASHSQPSLD